MNDIEKKLRAALLELQPRLDQSTTDQLIHEIPNCFQFIKKDDAQHGSTERQDFWNFVSFNGVAVATVYRKLELEVFVFLADDLLIHETGNLAMVEVETFLQTIQSRFGAPLKGLKFPMSEALPWLVRPRLVI